VPTVEEKNASTLRLAGLDRPDLHGLLLPTSSPAATRLSTAPLGRSSPDPRMCLCRTDR
jgi:hypothetical protein